MDGRVTAVDDIDHSLSRWRGEHVDPHGLGHVLPESAQQAEVGKAVDPHVDVDQSTTLSGKMGMKVVFASTCDAPCQKFGPLRASAASTRAGRAAAFMDASPAHRAL